MKNEYYIATHFSKAVFFFFYITYMHPLARIKKMLASVKGILSEVLHSFFIKTREPFLCNIVLLQKQKLQIFLWVCEHSEGAH